MDGDDTTNTNRLNHSRVDLKEPQEPLRPQIYGLLPPSYGGSNQVKKGTIVSNWLDLPASQGGVAGIYKEGKAFIRKERRIENRDSWKRASAP